MAEFFEFAPFRLSGAVYGTLLNHSSARAALADSFDLAPYKGAPKAPVLYLKPRNTLVEDGATVSIPRDSSELEIGANLGLVIGRPACKVQRSDALAHIAGYLIMNDISVPHSNYYRPSVRFKARDGFCPLGAVVARTVIADPNALNVRTYVDGELRHSVSTADLVLPVEELLEAVTEFMTLSPGDVLGVGVAARPPRVRAGEVSSIEVDGLGSLKTSYAGLPS